MDDEEMDDEEEYDFEYSDNLPSSDAEHDDEPSPVVRSRQSSLASSELSLRAAAHLER